MFRVIIIVIIIMFFFIPIIVNLINVRIVIMILILIAVVLSTIMSANVNEKVKRIGNNRRGMQKEGAAARRKKTFRCNEKDVWGRGRRRRNGRLVQWEIQGLSCRR